MQASEWAVLFSQDILSSFAWGRSVRDEHVTVNSCISLLHHANGSVFMVIISPHPSDILAFDFGRFWNICTYRRTMQIVTYRAGDSGMCVIFPTPSSLDRFEEACDHNLPAHPKETSPPTLEDLRDLGLVSVPEVLGSFLLDGRTEPVGRLPQEKQVGDDGQDSHDTFLFSDWAGPIAGPATEGTDWPLREEVDALAEGSDASSISGLSDFDVTDLDADDLEGLVDEDGDALDALLCDAALFQRFEFPSNFM
ncbi:hypothetical protein L226DRAFT_571713 [Lentinus tigrinus ALCF2SS1-7]|uniref:uncharacterized protein n=1 Tax=Lentinus tigrinus ALCF2SS1-7 TaxID=1328758 RepID=UPI001165D413|nr:hypothetical protein L226DRAFT_571713 [Lentinus tigrinus ALCF2SS1-7]